MTAFRFANSGIFAKVQSRALGVLLFFLLLGGVFLRTTDLGRSATRSDEMNQIRYAQNDESILRLWQSPPWLNQIVFADTFSIVWARLMPWRTVDERLTREPYALLGCLTLLVCVVWLWRKDGRCSALLAALWLGLSPFLVYHSREAYFYASSIFFSTGMALQTVNMLTKISRGSRPGPWAWAAWFAWTLTACLSHMSAWALFGVASLLLLGAGIRYFRERVRRRFLVAWGLANLVLLLFLARWIWLAVSLMLKVGEGSVRNLGGSFVWIAPRVLPLLLGGNNAVGWGLLVMVLVMVWVVRFRERGVVATGDVFFWLSVLLGGGIVSTYLYVGIAGGGLGKWAYFSSVSALLPLWGVMGVGRFWRTWRGGRGYGVGMAGMVLLVTGLLVVPAWQVTRLTGKPTAYREIRAALDTRLAPGDVALVDRWFEPWNEMAIYAPSNVVVSFTIPDELYEQYVENNWRGVTRDVIERNGAQAFIRLARNHEERMGLWTWPETWFRQRVVVTNEAGVWLRDTGFAPMEEFYTDQNRVETEIFYDTHADIAERARTAGQSAVRFFGRGWQVFKPWQQGDFHDYRVLTGGAEAEMEVWNLRPEPMRARLDVTGAASGAPQVVQVGDSPALTFAPGQLESKSLEMELPPGVSMLPWRNRSGGGALLVQDVRVEAQP